MGLRYRIKKTAMGALRRMYSRGPSPGVAKPIFILGCGRSGTTVLGRTLANHRKVTYLNEPRDLWFSAFPETDVWTSKADVRGGKLYLCESDVDHKKSNRLRRMFRFETIVTGRPVLIEKLPINSFRLRFIHSIFPDAKYIHIYRNGLEVARSIQEINKHSDWFGSNHYKWRKIVEHARAESGAGDVAGVCTTDFEKGLLEWRLSTESIVTFLGKLPDQAYFELSYDDFVTHPKTVVPRLLGFIGVDADTAVDDFVTSVVRRQTASSRDSDITEKLRAIGGELLPLSMDAGGSLTERSKLTKRSKHRS